MELNWYKKTEDRVKARKKREKSEKWGWGDRGGVGVGEELEWGR